MRYVNEKPNDIKRVCSCAQDVESGQVDTEEWNASMEEADHYNCEDGYQLKIWDKALGNPAAMELLENTLVTVKELGTDEVCSDSSRAFFNFVKVMIESPNAHYSIGMMMKMIAVIMREIDMSEKSSQFKETSKVINQIISNEDVQKLTLTFINKSVDLLKDRNTRDRLFRLLKVVEGLMQPSESETKVKEGINQVKEMASTQATKVKGALGRIRSIFQG